MKNIYRFIIMACVLCVQITSCYTHARRALTWREQLQINALCNTSSQDAQDKQFFYIIGLLLAQKYGFTPVDIRSHSGDINGCPLIINDSDDSFAQIIDYINAWNDPLKMVELLKERGKKHGYTYQEAESLHYLKLEYISALLSDAGLDGRQEVIDELNEVGGYV